MILPQQKASAVSAPWLIVFGAGQNSASWSSIGTTAKEEGRRPQRCPAPRPWSLVVLPLKMCLVNLQSVELWQVLESRLSNKLDGIVIKVAAK